MAVFYLVCTQEGMPLIYVIASGLFDLSEFSDICMLFYVHIRYILYMTSFFS